MSEDNERIIPSNDAMEDVVVDVVDAPNSEPDTKPEVVAETKPEVEIDAAADGVEAIKRNLEEEKQRRIEEQQKRLEAERRAQKAETTAQEKEKNTVDANRLAANNHIAASKSELERNRRLAAELQADGKFYEAEDARLAAYKAQTEIDRANSYLAQLDRIEQQPKQQAPERPEVYSDPVTGNEYTQRTGKWISEHADIWADDEARADIFGYDAMAVARGIQRDTPAYFSFIEKKLGLDKKDAQAMAETSEEKPAVTTKPSQAAQRKPSAASVSAAPSRNVAGSPGAPKQGVKVSGEQREVMEAITRNLPELFKGENPDQLAAKMIKTLEKEKGSDWATNFNR